MSIKTMLDRIKEKIIFNDRLASWAGAAFFLFWIGQRWYFSYRPTVLWWLVTFQFSLFVLAYLTRHRAISHGQGFWETVYPFLCSAMPFTLDDYPFKPLGLPLIAKEVYLSLMLAGTVLIIAGVFTLRRSFAIMTEARPPVLSGIYRLTRHPMYLGSMISALGLLLYNYHFLNFTLFSLFCAMQVYRARREERKMSEISPQYRDYLLRVGWLGPWDRTAKNKGK
ncbi:MAG: NnrU family protein [Thermodesulfobacteriota bacterium]